MSPTTLEMGRVAREKFLSSGEITDAVRPLTARSWLRSRAAGVVPDKPLSLDYAGEVEADSALLRAARPVAEQLFAGEMHDMDVAMFVTDDDARIVGRWGGHPGLLAHLDAVGSSPGFVFEETRAGTSALGTALEEGVPVLVLGHEHYADSLQNLSAVGVPIVHPVSGRVQGVVDLVCNADSYSPMMVPLVTRLAHEIGERLLTGFGAQDRGLLEAYLLADRRGPRRPLVAINSRLLIANPHAEEALGGMDHGLLRTMVERALAAHETVLTLGGEPESGTLQASIAEVRDGGAQVGAILKLERKQPRVEPVRRGSVAEAPAFSRQLPGSSARWQTALQQSSLAVRRGHRLLLTGLTGVGKRELALALCAADHPSRAVQELDAADASEDSWFQTLAAAAQDDATVLLVTHLNLLSPALLQRFCRVIDRSGGPDSRLVATFTIGDDGRTPTVLAGQFPHRVELPALVDRVEDIAPIVEMVLRQDGSESAARIDSAAMRVLESAEWPANVRQLAETVRAAQAACPGSVIRVDDLPAQCRVPRPRVRLTRLQRHERQEIIATLAAEGGNKKAAAEKLRISRSTLYRKLTTFGFDV